MTLAVEVPIYGLALIAAGVSWRRALIVGVGVNVVTHPVLWLGLRSVVDRPAYPRIMLLAEVGVCLVEWGLLAWWTGRRRSTDPALLAALAIAANAASTLVGLLM